MKVLAFVTLFVTVLIPARPAVAQGRPDLLVSLEWLKAHADDPKVAVVAASADRAEYESAHLPRAGYVGHMDTIGDEHRLLKPDELAAVFARAGATDDARIVIYGDDGMSVGWLFMALASIGHGAHTSVVDGNLRSWMKAGYPVAKGPSAAARGALTARPATDVVVDAPWVRDRLKDASFQLLDVRSPKEWSGGMIPGATKVRWEDLYSDMPGGRFKPAAEIRALVERAGVTPGKTAVTYCAVGMRASLVYFAARLIGVPARVYQGSWSDWQGREGYPIVK